VNAREGTRKQFTECALARLRMLAWPGNVRELENAVERAAILADETLDAETLPRPGARELIARDAVLQIPVGTSLEAIERGAILATFESLGGDKRRTAAVLGISVKTLYNRLNVYQAEQHGGDAGSSAHEAGARANSGVAIGPGRKLSRLGEQDAGPC